MKRLCVLLLIILCVTGVNFALAGQAKDASIETPGYAGSAHRIVDTYTFPGAKVIQSTLPVLSVYSYMVISDGEALVVDPVRDISFYLETAKKEGATIKGVYLSHSHADFVAGHSELVKAVGCTIYQSHKSGAEYPFKPVDENSSVHIGQALLKFLDTPGHTPDGMCCIVAGIHNPDVPKVMFTGDVLFVGSVGRPDLMGGTVSAAWLAGATFDSWTNKLSKLPDSVIILPAHGAGSLCGSKLSSDPSSTIGKERKSNPYLQHTKKSEFVAAVLQGLPEAPQYFKHNAKMNREGPPTVNWTAALPKDMEPTPDLVDPAKYQVVDIRDARSYGGAHIPNSLNIPTTGRFESWVGTMVPWGTKVVLVGDAALLKRALFRLHRIGYTADVISMESWKRSRLGISIAKLTENRDLLKLMKKGEAPIVVDVRKPPEWTASRIGTVLNLPVNRLATLSTLLDPNDPVMLICRSGYRSGMAVGILERKGFKKATSVDGGMKAWTKAELPVVEVKKD